MNLKFINIFMNFNKIVNIILNNFSIIKENNITSKHTQINILESIGYKIIKYVGGGYYGSCYLSDKNRIIKITLDLQNALASNRLIGENMEYLCNSYKVIRIFSNKENYEAYVIEMENCDTLKIDKNKLQRAFKYFKLKMNPIHNFSINSYIRDFIKIKKESNKYGITIDLQNYGNFGIKNGHLCLLDYGEPWSFNFKIENEFKEKIKSIDLDKLKLFDQEHNS